MPMSKLTRAPGRYWINAPSTLQSYHEYHGAIGILAGDYFFFAKGAKGTKGDEISIYAGGCLQPFLSIGWPEHLREASDKLSDENKRLKESLAEIGKMLSDHSEFKRGNTIVHYCAHKALGAAQ